MIRVDFTYPAELDVNAAADFYNAQQPGLGNEFRLEVAATAGLIAAQPGIGGRVGRRAVRRVLLQRFPFSLVYVVRGGVADVLVVPHHSQHPRTWSNRLP